MWRGEGYSLLTGLRLENSGRSSRRIFRLWPTGQYLAASLPQDQVEWISIFNKLIAPMLFGRVLGSAEPINIGGLMVGEPEPGPKTIS